MPGSAPDHPDRQAAELQRKLENLQRLIDQADLDTVGTLDKIPPPPDQQAAALMERMQQQVSAIQQQSAAPDPQLDAMSGMLDKILDIQHPQLVNERLKQQSLNSKGAVLPVSVDPSPAHQEYFGQLAANTSAGPSNAVPASAPFYGSGTGKQANDLLEHTAIRALVHDDQELVSGATIKLRLEQSVYINGRLIPKGAFVWGRCTLDGERLNVDISSVRNGSQLFPVQLAVYDFDGNAGIRIPGSISRDASKQAADQAIQSVALTSLNSSLETQAAAAGIETAKNLIGKKIRLIRVTVKSGYPILLKSNKQPSF